MEFLTSLLKKFLLLCCAGILSFAWVDACGAQTGSKTGPKEELPLNITAERLDVEQNEQVVSFVNNVIARYKDIILYADILKIFYQAQTDPGRGKDTATSGARASGPGTPGANPPDTPKKGETSPLGAVGIEKITRIEAQGRVRIVQGDRLASGDKAVFYTQEDKIVLSGNPQLWRGENSLKGQEIIFFLKENRAVVEGGTQKRVEAVIYPSQKIQLPGGPKATAP